jgi:hypothetical protein
MIFPHTINVRISLGLILAALSAASLSCNTRTKPVMVVAAVAPTSDGVEATEHRIFVTSTTTNAALGGLSGADQFCQQAAKDAGLSRTYKAILSTTHKNAKDRISIRGAIYKVYNSGNKSKVAADERELWGGGLHENVNITEMGTTVGNSPWTATNSSGIYSGKGDCGGWEETGSTTDAGMSTSASGWLCCTTYSCASHKPLYCISQ